MALFMEHPLIVPASKSCPKIIRVHWWIYTYKLYVYAYLSYKLECDLGLWLDARRGCDSSFLSRLRLEVPVIPRI